MRAIVRGLGASPACLRSRQPSRGLAALGLTAAVAASTVRYYFFGSAG